MGRRKLHDRLQRDFRMGKEEKDRLELLRQVRIWYDMWADVDADCHPHESRGPVRGAIIHARKIVMHFCEVEAHQLPSRVLRRRVVALDEQVVRMVNNALPAIGRANLRDEAKASVKNHGGPAKAHEARIIRDKYGIPRF